MMMMATTMKVMMIGKLLSFNFDLRVCILLQYY